MGRPTECSQVLYLRAIPDAGAKHDEQPELVKLPEF